MSEEENKPQESRIPQPKIRLAPKSVTPRGIPLKPSLRPAASVPPAKEKVPAQSEQSSSIEVDAEEATTVPASAAAKPLEAETIVAAAGDKPVSSGEDAPVADKAPAPAAGDEPAEAAKEQESDAATAKPVFVKPKPHIVTPAPKVQVAARKRPAAAAVSPVSLGIDIFTTAAALAVAFLVLNDLLKFL